MKSGTIVCPKCNGRGTLPDARLQGQVMRALREKAGVPLNEVARRMNFTGAYISDLEQGRRAWRPILIGRYKQALK